MTLTEGLILAAYFFILCILAVYGWHRYYLVFLYMKHRQNVPGPLPEPDPLPVVTIQLPIYNEMYVVNRLIESVLAMDYPRHLLEIQVLDDSTDETREIAELAVRRHADQGFDIKYIHRVDRTGYKAGALDAGLSDRARRVRRHLRRRFHRPGRFPAPHGAAVRRSQDRDGAGALGPHQPRLLAADARSRPSCSTATSCSSTAAATGPAASSTSTAPPASGGRNVIADAGGWQHDTLTEDLDLSYRAQLRGWKFVFMQDLVSPAEVPVEMNAFKSQQHRWAKGSIQTCRKVLPRILQSDLPILVKAEAFFHLTANFNYLLMVLLSLLMFPSMYVRYNMGWTEMMLIDVPLFFAATFSVFNFYMVCQRELFPDTWTSRLKYLPFVMSIGIGLCINNARAVIEALLHKESGEFARTPKYGIERDSDDWQGKKYHQIELAQPLIECALGLYFTITVFYALAYGIYGTLPFLVLFQVGFLYTGLLSIVQQFGGDDMALRTQAAGE